MFEEKGWLTVEDLAALLGLSHTQAHRLVECDRRSSDTAELLLSEPIRPYTRGERLEGPPRRAFR